MFSSTNKNNWTLCSCNCTKCTSTFGMSIKFSNNNLTNSDGFMESLCLVITCLTNGTIHNKDWRVRFYGSFNLKHFIEKWLFLLMTTRGINNDNFIFFLSKECYTFFCNFNWICFILMTKKWALNFCRVHLKLSKCTSSECICTYETNSPASLHVVIG